MCLALAAPVFAQQAPPPNRPKLGLVLSGGGAMGIAHVGAIQTLEKLGIRPDFVVGTSMGSIVGGLYASGMSGAELEHAVETMNWDLIFDTTPPRAGLTYREKQLRNEAARAGSPGVGRQPPARASPPGTGARGHADL
jgi:NTE family protein